jgi:hypothetical protein
MTLKGDFCFVVFFPDEITRQIGFISFICAVAHRDIVPNRACFRLIPLEAQAGSVLGPAG